MEALAETIRASYLADFKAGHVIGDGQLGRRKMGVSLHCRRATEPLEEVPLLQLNFPSLHPFESRSLPAILLEFAALSLMATHNIPNATLVQLEPEPQSANDGRARWIIAPRPDKVGTASHAPGPADADIRGKLAFDLITQAGTHLDRAQSARHV